MGAKPIQPSFTGGELSPTLFGRVDLERWGTSLKTCRNFIVQADGGVVNMPGNQQTANQIGAFDVTGNVGSEGAWFNTSAFAQPQGVVLGNTGRNAFRGPGQWRVDFSLFRGFALGGTKRLEFRAEAFNATNTPHFNNPGANVSNMRLNADGTVNTLGGYTEITSARPDERQVRLGVRVAF